MKKTILLFFCLIFLSSCFVRNTIEWKKYDGDFSSWKKYALLDLIICPSQTPAFPIIDAGLYNSSFDDIVVDIQSLHEQKALDVHRHLGRVLSKYSDNEVLYGKYLYKTELYKKLLNEIPVYSCELFNNTFLNFTIPTDSYNFFNLMRRSTPEDYFDINSIRNHKELFKKICKTLKVDGVIIGTLAVNTESVGLFGTSGRRRMFLQLYFVDKKGDYVMYGLTRSKGTVGSPDDIGNYKEIFDEYYYYSDVLIRKLYGLPIEDIDGNDDVLEEDMEFEE